MGGPTKTYDAMTIAKWFIKWAASEGADLSNLKLQKLLYYAQGHCLGTYRQRLFRDPIQAWSHGPVVPDVYHAFKKHRDGDVKMPDEGLRWSSVDDTATDLLIDVWEEYGSLAAWKLRNMTHEERPWVDSFQPKTRHVEIKVDRIESFFRDLRTS